MSSDDIALSINGVSKCFEIYEKPVHRLFQTLCAGHKKFYREFWALRNISVEVKRGECVGVIGRNGAGKSTLLQIITGTLQPTEGSVTVNGKVAALLELGSGFNPEFSGRENVYMNAAILGLDDAALEAKYQEIVDFADIGDFIDQPVKTYSSGMMVRLAFAVQAMVKPDVLIVDEALSVGDLAFQNKCIRVLNDLIDAGTTVFFCSHDISTVQRICTNAIWIDKGEVRMAGDPSDVCAAYESELLKGSRSVPPSADNRSLRTQQTTGFAHFVKLEIDRSIYTPRQTMLIRYELEAEKELKDYCFGLSVYNAADVWLIGQCSFDDNGIIDKLNAGERRSGTIRIPELRLASGDYSLYLGIHSSDYKEYYALNTNPIRFSVRSGNPSWGCISIPIDWKYE